jgi:hypothetical protein
MGPGSPFLFFSGPTVPAPPLLGVRSVGLRVARPLRALWNGHTRQHLSSRRIKAPREVTACHLIARAHATYMLDPSCGRVIALDRDTFYRELDGMPERQIRAMIEVRRRERALLAQCTGRESRCKRITSLG